jgi:hypothetical protein
MAKDRIERDELASKLIETASSAEDPLRAMAELLTDFVMEAEVTVCANRTGFWHKGGAYPCILGLHQSHYRGMSA